MFKIKLIIRQYKRWSGPIAKQKIVIHDNNYLFECVDHNIIKLICEFLSNTDEINFLSTNKKLHRLKKTIISNVLINLIDNIYALSYNIDYTCLTFRSKKYDYMNPEKIIYVPDHMYINYDLNIENFFKSKNLSNIKSLTIKNHILTDKYLNLFNQCTNVEFIDISLCSFQISIYFLKSCTKLKKIFLYIYTTYPTNISNIFKYCSELEEIKFEGCSGMEIDTFDYCPKLLHIDVGNFFGNNIDGLFYQNPLLETITFKSYYGKLTRTTFKYCSNLKSIHFGPLSRQLHLTDQFASCQKLSTIFLPNEYKHDTVSLQKNNPGVVIIYE